MPGKALSRTAGTLSNSQCSIDVSQSSGAGLGTQYKLILSMSFNQSFSGNKMIYLAARDSSGGNSGWGIFGVRSISPKSITQPNSLSVAPNPAAGFQPTLTLTFSDTAWQNISIANGLINTALDGRQAGYFGYDPTNNLFYLVNDVGGGTLPPITLNQSSGSVTNGQCTIFSLPRRNLWLTISLSNLRIQETAELADRKSTRLNSSHRH